MGEENHWPLFHKFFAIAIRNIFNDKNFVNNSIFNFFLVLKNLGTDVNTQGHLPIWQ